MDRLRRHGRAVVPAGAATLARAAFRGQFGLLGPLRWRGLFGERHAPAEREACGDATRGEPPSGT
ncbi:hypothetical protein [Kibdelosporangium philippinense]|uniref:hypothetical protein n=1 Tax=Kibdelosporangium philippinense TaxID=211113 RepID=UPI00360E82EE